ncbi:hypothetical protein LMG7974_01630 [Campylobacter majalis]|uniref:DUF4406 domain-containing protein n=1 Tax=Campylobacter majalis TaxID=2790656 RepID=A0ABM8Q9G3_9BACT|nr:hypothetical protein [Campylobacter majalis]CAD7289553.1 hypothetical protein LMG7974_01630 [Campylobacter majalis]
MKEIQMHFRALKVAYMFKQHEIISLIGRFNCLTHLRLALKIKRDENMSKIKIYVASPYDAMLNRGFSLDEVMQVAKKTKKNAINYFLGFDFDYFSPVLEFGDKGLSRDVAMKSCFAELLMADFLYIGDGEFVNKSEGIYEEYRFCIENNIAVVFARREIREEFKQRLDAENSAKNAF